MSHGTIYQLTSLRARDIDCERMSCLQGGSVEVRSVVLAVDSYGLSP